MFCDFFMTFYVNHVNVASKSKKQKNYEKMFQFILKVTIENSRIRIRKSGVRIPGSVPRIHNTGPKEHHTF